MAVNTFLPAGQVPREEATPSKTDATVSLQAPREFDSPTDFIVSNDTDGTTKVANPVSAGDLFLEQAKIGLTGSLSNQFKDEWNALPETQETADSISLAAEQAGVKYALSQAVIDDLAYTARSPDEVARKAKRINESQAYNMSLENTGMAKQMSVGMAGFVLADPTNLIPGAVLIKGGVALSKVLPRLTTALNASKVSKGVTYSGLAATEEAIRNAPRLNSDPSYTYETYKADVVMGAAFGAAFAFAPGALGAVKNGIGASVTKVADSYKSSLNAKLAVSTLTDALHLTKEKPAKKALVDAIEAATGKEEYSAAIKAAKMDRLQSEIDNHSFVKRVQEVEKLLATDRIDLVETIPMAMERLVKDLEVAPNVKAAATLAIREADARLKATVAAAKDNVGPELSPELADAKMIRDAFKAVDDVVNIVDSSLGKVNSIRLQVARMAMNRAVLDKAAILGVKPKSVKLDAKVVAEIIGEKFLKKDYQREINKIDETLQEILIKAGIGDVGLVSATIHKAMFTAGTSLKNFSKGLEADVKLGRRVEVALDKHFDELLDVTRSRTSTKADFKEVDDLGGALGKTSRKTGKIRIRKGLTKDEIMNHIRGAIDNPVSKQKKVVLGAQPNLMKRLEDMDIDTLKDFIIRHEFAHTKQDLSKPGSNAKQSIAESLGLADKTNKHLADSEVKLEMAANSEALRGIDRANAVTNALEAAHNKVRADVQWAILATKDRNSAQIAMEPQWALMSKDIEDMFGGDLTVLGDIYNSTTTKAIRNSLGGLSRSYAGDLAQSRSPLAQWAAMNIFELPGGTGAAVGRKETAAISASMFEAKAVHPVNEAWLKAVREEARIRGLDPLARAQMKWSNATVDSNANVLGRKIQAEQSARQAGKKSNAEPHVKAMVDDLETAYDGLYQNLYDHGVQGFNGTNRRQSYAPQVWSPNKLTSALVDADGIGEEGLEVVIKNALHSRNPNATGEELAAQAAVVIKRAKENINDPQGGVTDNVVSDGSYVNSRVLDMDVTAKVLVDGREQSMMDFLSNDPITDLNRYAKRASAQAAISKASNGKLNSADAIKGFIHAVGAEAQARGTLVDVNDMTNAFKLMMGQPIMGFDKRVRKIRDGVSLSGMNGLGESQLAELGLAVNRGMAGMFATKQVIGRVAGELKGKWTGLQLTPAQAADTNLLSQMQSVSTLFESMHSIARQNVHFEDSYKPASTSTAVKALDSAVDTVTGGKFRPLLQHMQTTWTGYGKIRTMQEQIAMAGLMHDAGKALSGLSPSFTSAKRFADIGLPVQLLKKKLKEGTIKIDSKGNMTDLGLEQWSKAEMHSLGVALRRHSAQQVQVGFAGETSALMQNPWVAFMMQFKSYPTLAAEKQMLRNVMFADKEAAMGVALNAATSMGARVIRYQSMALALKPEERESYLKGKYENDLVTDTALYMGGVGSLGVAYQMATEPERNIPPPFISWASNYVKTVQGAGNGLSTKDVANLATALPLGTIAQANAIRGIIGDIPELPNKLPSLPSLKLPVDPKPTKAPVQAPTKAPVQKPKGLSKTEKRVQKFENSIKAGFSKGTWKPHKSPEGGTKTLAYGHKLTKSEVKANAVQVNGKSLNLSKGLTESQAQALFKQDWNKAGEGVKRIIRDKKMNSLPKKAKDVLQEMVFQMGESGVRLFKNTLKEMKEGKFEQAADRMLKSIWAREQSPKRAKILSEDIRSLK